MFAGGTENNSSFSFETLSENSINQQGIELKILLAFASFPPLYTNFYPEDRPL